MENENPNYFMSHPRRGHALIFSHYQFDSKKLKKPQGREMDQERLEGAFRKFGFKVKSFIDSTKMGIKGHLQEGNICVTCVVFR